MRERYARGQELLEFVVERLFLLKAELHGGNEAPFAARSESKVRPNGNRLAFGTAGSLVETMSAQPVREGYNDITPALIVRGGAAAIEFYQKAFGGTIRHRMDAPDGKVMHAEVLIGNSVVMVSDEFPEWGALSPETLKGSPISLYLYVTDADAVFEKAVAAGATVSRPLENQFWGDRVGWLLDPFGHKWSISAHVEDVSPDEMTRRAEAFVAPEKS